MTDEKPVARITAMFAVEGWSFDPEQLTKIAGCKPTKIWYQQLDALKGNPDFAQIGWWYDHTKIPRWSLDDAVREILQVFYERRREIVEFAGEHNCSIHLSLVLHGDETQLVYVIEQKTIAMLAEFRCSISFAVQI